MLLAAGVGRIRMHLNLCVCVSGSAADVGPGDDPVLGRERTVPAGGPGHDTLIVQSTCGLRRAADADVG